MLFPTEHVATDALWAFCSDFVSQTCLDTVSKQTAMFPTAATNLSPQESEITRTVQCCGSASPVFVWQPRPGRLDCPRGQWHVSKKGRNEMFVDGFGRNLHLVSSRHVPLADLKDCLRGWRLFRLVCFVAERSHWIWHLHHSQQKPRPCLACDTIVALWTIWDGTMAAAMTLQLLHWIENSRFPKNMIKVRVQHSINIPKKQPMDWESTTDGSSAHLGPNCRAPANDSVAAQPHERPQTPRKFVRGLTKLKMPI